MKGLVFDIKKFAIHDGPGIRTTVFFKGCPLNCLWCHNPESQSKMPEISFVSDKCIGCGYCVAACPNQCHKLLDHKHFFNREDCVKCGKCAGKCYTEALEIIGKEMTISAIMDEVMKDTLFYETSGGGMTISGGEPMAQFAFTRTLLKAAKEKGLHICLDTCGFAPFDQYQQIIDSVDIFLYDLKETDPQKHKEFTGVPLSPILDNLKKLDEAGAKTILRCPLIPGLNDREDHLLKIAKIANSMKNLKEIYILPYHPLGISKNHMIGKKNSFNDKTFPKEKTVDTCLKTIGEYTQLHVFKG